MSNVSAKLSRPILAVVLTCITALVFMLPGPVFAKKPSRVCALGLVQKTPYIQLAALKAPVIPKRHGRITFVGHSTMMVESPQGVSVATDYNGFNQLTTWPDIVTMNNSHITHYTEVIDPRVKFVLRGWDPKGGVAKHDIQVKDMRVYNVPTNFEVVEGRKANQNSIFIIEAAQLCFAHVGHLHHVLTDNQTLKVGRIDVLFLPIDGAYTMSYQDAAKVIAKVRPKLVIPMHFFGFEEGNTFIQHLKGAYPVQHLKKTSMLMNRKDLPKSTEIWFLREVIVGGLGLDD
ncbi:MAG: MBL fold metallo-hydrolase [Rhodospirillales bacterium]|jgi:L-ascorbate metabolism protein UlaG (beta-lactamase superfamily)